MNDKDNNHQDKSKNQSNFPTISLPDSSAVIGGEIGPYGLLSVLGEGGFGIVYLAEQKRPVKRTVALKIIKPGMDTKQVIARFEAERQALALLEHPNIARVYNAGSTETGRPYFVMEYINGMPITEYCDHNKLSIKERLELFIQICEAVQHAHQKGIIHRDIKPSNIVIDVIDGKPVPKIIDFGVAKAISMPLTEKTMFTQQGQLIGTPEYMSPEQADLKEKDIDTRTDIYSLGVVLYELLAGTLPFEPETLREGGYAEIQRIIREQEPPRPSTKLSSLGENAKKVAQGRHIELSTLVKSLHKELEWIPLMAIRKDRDQRYKTASDLAEDVQNYLDGNPLVAGPESAAYKFKKFVKKRKGLVAAVASIATVLITGIIVSSTLYVQAKQAKEEEAAQRQVAQQEAIRANIQADIARKAQDTAEREAYCSTMQHIWSKLKAGNHYGVRTMLENTDPSLRGWEWGYIKKMCQLPEWSLSVLEDSSYLSALCATKDGKYILTGGADKLIVWKGQPLFPNWQKKLNWPYIADIDPNGKYVVYANNNSFVLCDINSGHSICNLDEQKVSSVCIHPSGKQIYAGTKDGRLIILNAANLEIIKMLKVSDLEIRHLAIGSKGKALLSSPGNGDTGSSIILHDPESLKIISKHYKTSGEGIRGIALLDEQEKVLIVDGWSDVDVLSMDLSKVTTSLIGHSGNIISLKVIDDGKKIITGSEDGTANVYDANSLSLLGTIYNDSRVDSSLFVDSKIFTLGRGILRQWSSCGIPDFDPSVKYKELSNARVWVTELNYRMDGKLIAANGYGYSKPIVCDVENNTTKSMEIEGWRNLKNYNEKSKSLFRPHSDELAVYTDRKFHFYDTSSGGFPEIHCLDLVNDICSAIFDPTGEHLVISYVDGKIELFNLVLGTRLVLTESFREVKTSYMSFNDDGSKLAIIESFPTPCNLILFDMSNPKIIWEKKFHRIRIDSIAFHPDEDLVALGKKDGSIELWDTGKRICVKSFTGHLDTPVRNLDFSIDGDRLLSGGIDRKICLWDWKIKKKLLVFESPWYAITPIFSPDGMSIASGGHPNSPIEIRTASEWRDWKYYEEVAKRHSENNDFKKAVDFQKKAIKLIPEDQSDLLAKSKYILQLYQSSKPYSMGSPWSFSTGELVAQWDFDQIEEDIVKDSSKNELHGKLMGDAAIVDDPQRGKVLSLDGDGDYVDCGNNWMFDISGSITISAWIKTDKLQTFWVSLLSKGRYSYRLLNDENSGTVGFHLNSSSKNTEQCYGTTPIANLTDNRWHRVDAVYDGQKMSLYIDGKLDSKLFTTSRINITPDPVYIGIAFGAPRYWQGLMDDVRIYSRALSPEEITKLYKEEPVKPE